VVSSDSGSGFLQWAGAPQQAYEQLRAAALRGGDTELFQQWGMSLVCRERACALGLWTVKRVRAPVRAGQLVLEHLLSELCIAGRPCRSMPVAQMKEVSL
jgi:hypothetical protein